MIIDIHAHYHPRAYSEALSRATGRPVSSFASSVKVDTDDDDHIAKRLEMMDEAGVGLQVITPAGGRAPYLADETAAVEAARLYNDRAASLVARRPDRFKSFVSLPLPHIDASLRELKRGLDELGMIGVNMHISALDRSVAEDEFLPLYEEIDRRHGLIFYHPATNSACCPNDCRLWLRRRSRNLTGRHRHRPASHREANSAQVPKHHLRHPALWRHARDAARPAQ